MTETPTPIPACPFCGGEAKRVNNLPRIYWNECTECLMRTDTFLSSVQADAAWSRRVTPDAGVREALEDARRFVKAELDARIDSHTLGGDMATLDDQDEGIVGEAMDCLARIDAALASTPPQVKTDAGVRRTMENAPRDGTEIIVCWPQQGNTMQLVSWNLVYKCWTSKGSALCVMQATHWQPLPSPPQVTP